MTTKLSVDEGLLGPETGSRQFVSRDADNLDGWVIQMSDGGRFVSGEEGGCENLLFADCSDAILFDLENEAYAVVGRFREQNRCWNHSLRVRPVKIGFQATLGDLESGDVFKFPSGGVLWMRGPSEGQGNIPATIIGPSRDGSDVGAQRWFAFDRPVIPVTDARIVAD